MRIATVWRARGELRFLPLRAKTATEAVFFLRRRDGVRRETSLTEGFRPLQPFRLASLGTLPYTGRAKAR